MAECIFCSIANKEEEAEIVFENEKFVAFRDIHPKAPVHLLIVPKEHIASAADLTEEYKELAGELLLTARKVAEQLQLTGYKLQINVGREGGQVVDHLHVHLLSGPIAQTL